MRKRLSLGAVLLTGILIIGVMGPVYAQQQDKNDCAGVKINGIVGQVQYLLKGLKDWKDAQLNLCLKDGDQVKTMAGAKAAMVLMDGTQMRLNELSSMTVVVTTRQDGTTSVDKVTLASGQVWAKVTTQGKKFEIETPAATAGVRGTEFTVEVSQDGKEAKVNVLEGVVSVLNQFGEQIAKAGEAIDALFDKIPGLPQEFNIEEFQNKLNQWKDAIQIDKVIEAKLDEAKQDIQNKVDNKIKGKLKF